MENQAREERKREGGGEGDLRMVRGRRAEDLGGAGPGREGYARAASVSRAESNWYLQRAGETAQHTGGGRLRSTAVAVDRRAADIRAGESTYFGGGQSTLV